VNLRVAAILFHCIAVATANAQALILPGDPAFSKVEEFFREDFRSASGPQKLKCSLQQIAPRVTFNFRFFTGFFASLPVQQFVGREKNSIAMIMRVTPADAPEKSAYFVYRNDLPELPKDVGRSRFEFSGGFYTGPGKYRVEIALRDGADRTCIANWQSTAQDRKVPIQLAAGQITPLGYDTWRGLKNAGSPDGGRVTVFVHAIPLYYRRALSKLGAFDRTTLLTSLTSLLDQSKFASARVVVFDLLGKRVLFEQDDFDRRGYRRLIGVLERTDYGTVDVRTLQQGGTDSTFIRNLLRDEMKRQNQSEAIVFLGAEGRPAPKALPDLKEYNLPAMFYMGFTRFQIPMEDAMYQAVRSTKGKTLTIYRPVDLANGIRSLVQTTGNGGGAP
jgi:hypothetical protein